MPLEVLPGSEPENPPIKEAQFPSQDEGIFNDKELLDRLEQNYSQASPIWQSFWNEANMDMRVYAGDQSVWSSYGTDMPANGRRQMHFNRTARVVEMVSGHQRKSRKTSIVTPQENSDQQVADDISGVLQWAYTKDKAYHKISDAFGSAMKVGLSFVESWLDRRTDIVHGDLKHRVIEYGSVFCDPFFRNLDLSDCGYIWVRRYMHKKQLISLMPDRKDEINSISTADLRDAKFYFMPENNQYSIRGMVPVDEYWYADTREARALVNIKTGEMKEVKMGVKIDPQLFIDIPDLREVHYTTPTVRLGIIANRKVLYHGENPLGTDRYPFTPFVGYFEPSFNDWPYRFQGVVRRLRDAQYLYNRRKILELDILESQVNSGELVEEDFYLTPEDAMKTGNGAVRFFKRGKNPAVSRVREVPAAIPESMIALSESLANEIVQISGVNEELLGMAEDDKAGILSMLRQGAGLTTLQTLFDRLDSSQNMMAEIDIEIMQKNWSKDKFARILGRMPTEDLASPYIEKYDISVEEGMLTSTQRQMQAAQLFQAYQMGIQTPEMVQAIIGSMNLQNKNELLSAMEQSNQAQQQQAQQQAQIEMQNMQIENEVLQSKAESDHALAMERMAKIETERMQALSAMEKAHQEDTAAMLNLVKALKELKGLDLEHLRTKVETLKHLSEMSNVRDVQQPQV